MAIVYRTYPAFEFLTVLSFYFVFLLSLLSSVNRLSILFTKSLTLPGNIFTESVFNIYRLWKYRKWIKNQQELAEAVILVQKMLKILQIEVEVVVVEIVEVFEVVAGEAEVVSEMLAVPAISTEAIIPVNYLIFLKTASCKTVKAVK